MRIPYAALRTLPSGANVYVGYGRDLADGFAKGTFVELPRSYVMPP